MIRLILIEFALSFVKKLAEYAVGVWVKVKRKKKGDTDGKTN